MNFQKKPLKYSLAVCGVALGIATLVAVTQSSTNFGRTVPVLMYHNILKVPDNVWSVSTDEFRRQMADLKKQGYQTVLPGDLKGGLFRKLPPKPIVITFDDGFLGCMTEAEPILKSFGFQAIVYLIITNVAGAGQARTLYRGQDALNWDDIRAMHRRQTFTFGIHSFGHTPSKRDEATELWQCRYTFKREVGIKPEHYCYPNGVAPEFLVDEVKRRKYRTGMICEDQLFTIDKNTDWFRIPRVSVFGGVHDFTVLPGVAVEEGVFRATITNAGQVLPVKVVLKCKKSGASWSTPVFRRCGPEAIDCRWEGIPDEVKASDLAIEIWEQNGLFQYDP